MPAASAGTFQARPGPPTDRLAGALLALVLLPQGLVAVLTQTAWTMCGRKRCVLTTGTPAVVFGFALLCAAAGLALVAIDRGRSQQRWLRAARWCFAALAAGLGLLWLLLLP